LTERRDRNLKRFRLIEIRWVLLLILCLHASVSFSAEIYRWTDEKGTVHFTDDPSKVPQTDFKQTEKILLPEEKAGPPRETKKPDDRSDRVKTYLKELDKKLEAKRGIEKKISELETEVSSIEERLRWIEDYERQDFQYYQPFRDPRSNRWVMVASPYYDEKRRLTLRMESIKEELKSLHEELSKINRSL
jgi:hypothetical protein